MNFQEYISEQKPRLLSELTEFLSIPSVSADPAMNNAVQQCAEWTAERLRKAGIGSVEVHATDGCPIVYGEWTDAGSDKPTVLFYGHYDVQPVDPLHLWSNPPFEPTLRDGKIFARGATDDKGQVFLQIAAVEMLMKKHEGTLPVNIKFLIEGEEEIGSKHLEPFIREHSEKLKCDAVLISDTPIFAPGLPSLVYGLRGLCYMEIEATGPNRDLHSGSFGGAVENPINALCNIISQLKDNFGRITIDGFYDDVLPLDADERENFARLPYSEEDYKQSLNIPATWGEFGYSTYERIWARPTLDVNGIWGGYIGEGAKTVLPSKASAKISMRLVPNQQTEDIAKKIERYIRKIAPPTITVNIVNLHGADPAITPRDSQGVRSAMQALSMAYGVEPVLTREGGSIPVCLLFDSLLSAPVVLMGFGLNTENAHSPDEHFSLENFEKGILATAYFYEQMSQ